MGILLRGPVCSDVSQNLYHIILQADICHKTLSHRSECYDRNRDLLVHRILLCE